MENNVCRIQHFEPTQPLRIKATGNGSRQQCRTDKHGFPIRYVPKDPFVKEFQTGDIVRAIAMKNTLINDIKAYFIISFVGCGIGAAGVALFSFQPPDKNIFLGFGVAAIVLSVTGSATACAEYFLEKEEHKDEISSNIIPLDKVRSDRDD